MDQSERSNGVANAIPYISVASIGMAQVLGMSYEDVLARCSIRELLLYIGTQAQASTAPKLAEKPAPKKRKTQSVDEFTAEVLRMDSIKEEAS